MKISLPSLRSTAPMRTACEPAAAPAARSTAHVAASPGRWLRFAGLAGLLFAPTASAMPFGRRSHPLAPRANATNVPPWVHEDGLAEASMMKFATCTPQRLALGELGHCTGLVESRFTNEAIAPDSEQRFNLSYQVNGLKVGVPRGLNVTVVEQRLTTDAPSNFTVRATSPNVWIGPVNSTFGQMSSPLSIEANATLVDAVPINVTRS